MTSFGVSALLLGRLVRRPVPGLDQDLARHQAALRRLALMLSLQLVLYLGVALAQR